MAASLLNPYVKRSVKVKSLSDMTAWFSTPIFTEKNAYILMGKEA